MLAQALRRCATAPSRSSDDLAGGARDGGRAKAGDEARGGKEGLWRDDPCSGRDFASFLGCAFMRLQNRNALGLWTCTCSACFMGTWFAAKAGRHPFETAVSSFAVLLCGRFVARGVGRVWRRLSYQQQQQSVAAKTFFFFCQTDFGLCIAVRRLRRDIVLRAVGYLSSRQSSCVVRGAIAFFCALFVLS